MANGLNTDVLIVGAGPTGLTLACTLKMHNINFVIIDKSASRSTVPKASIMNARSLEVLQNIGAVDYALEVGLKINEVVIFAEGENLNQLLNGLKKPRGANCAPWN